MRSFCTGILNCALCYSCISDGCKNCPVCKFVGSSSCYDSPFRDWWVHYIDEHYGNCSDTRECSVCKDIALREVEFLERVKSAFL
jgi:hypothetical protein